MRANNLFKTLAKKHPNLTNELAIKESEQFFVSDITYIKNREKLHYLSLVTGAYSRKIFEVTG